MRVIFLPVWRECLLEASFWRLPTTAAVLWEGRSLSPLTPNCGLTQSQGEPCLLNHGAGGTGCLGFYIPVWYRQESKVKRHSLGCGQPESHYWGKCKSHFCSVSNISYTPNTPKARLKTILLIDFIVDFTWTDTFSLIHYSICFLGSWLKQSTAFQGC